MIEMWNTRTSKKYLLMFILIGILSFLQIEASTLGNESPVGLWRTIDDKTGKPSAIIEIKLQESILTGKIVKTLNPDAPAICEKCPGNRKNQPLIGLLIIRNLTQKSIAEWGNGYILDPDNGTEYKCKIKLIDDGNKMIVRGFIGISLLGRSQIWSREKI
jgi:uncharacterized protein (DUF2147 family)